MQFAWSDIIGSIGVATIILTYVLLQTERIKSESLLYSALNGAGAGLIVFSLVYSFNFSAFVVESLWVLISIINLYSKYGQSCSIRLIY
jgi:paired small multidrug resistance pump